MKIYCNGQRTTMRIWGHRWVCDNCGKRLWKADVTKRKSPSKGEVSEAIVYPGPYGFRYTLRGQDGRVVWDSPRAYKSRFAARDEINRLWPEARVSFEL